MGLMVTSGGIDITPYVEEESIQIKDALGQGGGTGGFAVGRASTASLPDDSRTCGAIRWSWK